MVEFIDKVFFGKSTISCTLGLLVKPGVYMVIFKISNKFMGLQSLHNTGDSMPQLKILIFSGVYEKYNILYPKIAKYSRGLHGINWIV